jgi:membrane-associated phospholipid phosphatase
MFRFFFLLILAFTTQNLAAQGLIIHKKTDLGISIGATALVGGSIWAERKVKILTPAQIQHFQMTPLPSWELGVNSKYRNPAKKASDILLFSSVGIAPIVALIATRNDKNQRNAALLLWYKGMITTTALTSWTKLVVKRTRPLVYNAQNPTSLLSKADARLSFFSGHTSSVAYNGFYAAQIFSTYYPNSRWKPLAWALGAGIPALTGVLRVRAGKHFPSDVLMGYAVGAGVALINHRLHRKK